MRARVLVPSRIMVDAETTLAVAASAERGCERNSPLLPLRVSLHLGRAKHPQLRKSCRTRRPSKQLAPSHPKVYISCEYAPVYSSLPSTQSRL